MRFISVLATVLLTASIVVHGQLRLPGNPGGASLASHYSGTIGWTWHVQGPTGWTNETMSASIINGRVACNGAHDELDQGQSQHVALNGTGLFDITFGTQRGRPYYVFEVSCPSVDNPKEASWSDVRSSYKQLGKQDETLKGHWVNGADDPAIGDPPDPNDPICSTVDAVNGVTETTTLTWELHQR